MVIIFAVVFSLFRLAVPYITDYGESIEAELTRQLGMPVEIGMVDADIAWLVPRLKLLDVSLYDVKGDRLFLHFEEINLSINWLESFRSLKPELGFISLVGLDLNIERDSKGDLIIQGFKIESTEQDVGEFIIPDEFNTLLENSSMYLVSSTLRWSDQLNNSQQLVFNNVNMALINNEPGHTLSIDMSLPQKYGEHVEFILDIKGALTEPWSWDGSVFVGIKNLKLEKWFDDYWQHVEFTGAGRLNANVWVDWSDQKPTEINAELNADKLALHYLDDDVRSWKLDGIAGKAKWKQDNKGWKLDVRNLEITRNKRTWPVASAVAVKMDQKLNAVGIKSNFLRIEDLAYLAALGARFIPLNDFDWNTMVAPYRPYGDLYDLNIYAPLDYLTQTKANTRFVDLSYSSSASVPSVKGLDGQLIYDSKGTVLQLDSRDVSLDFNGLFRNELFLTSVKGEVEIYNDQSGWLLQSAYLLVNTPHLNTATRFKVELPVDKPAYMDLVSRFEKGKGAYKGLYLPTKIMSEDVVEWLDDALVELDIPAGGVIYHGHLNEFPFLNDEGVFEVLFDVENATLQYMPDWPALKNMQAEVRFYNQGMSIRHAKGTIFDARFDNTEIDIENLDQTHVSVDGDVHGPLFDVLKFVKQSPLKEVVGSYITGFGVEGDTDLDLNLQIPVSSDDPVQVTGLLSFKGNTVYLPEENYRFKGFNGQLKFTENGVWAQKLSASLDDYPLEMSVSTIVKNKIPVTHLSAQGYLPVKSLLTPVPDLIPYMQGETDWEVDLYVPESVDNEASKIDIFVNSNLNGIRSTLLGPFSKSATEQAPFKLHLGILSDELNTYIKYSEDLKLAANLKDGRWVVNIDAPSLKGRSEFMADFSLNKTANIALEYIDVSEFAAEDDAPKSNIQVRDFPSFDFYAQKLDWEDKKFTDVNIQTHRIKTGMNIDHLELHAPGISIIGKGFWTGNWIYKNKTELNFKLEANNLGLGLNELNIAENIKDTKGEAIFKWKWDAEPYNFDWKILQGDMTFELENGSFTDIEAGAGRVLGMLNFETIFSLDFRSQVSDGFTFDDMNASFIFSDGYAITKNFEIESKVADIKIQGRVGMAAKNYDLQVEVFPKVSNAFTAIGVATGGPILGIGVHFFQKLFGVDEAAGSKSTVTGSWDAPVITEIGKSNSKNNSTAKDALDKNETNDAL